MSKISDRLSFQFSMLNSKECRLFSTTPQVCHPESQRRISLPLRMRDPSLRLRMTPEQCVYCQRYVRPYVSLFRHLPSLRTPHTLTRRTAVGGGGAELGQRRDDCGILAGNRGGVAFQVQAAALA